VIRSSCLLSEAAQQQPRRQRLSQLMSNFTLGFEEATHAFDFLVRRQRGSAGQTWPKCQLQFLTSLDRTKPISH
jgi:hypothetical protein